MSRDPLEELFGPLSDDSNATAPIPARKQLAHEQAERVRTAQLPATKQRGQKPDSDRGAKMKPWVIVGIVAVVAIIASIVVVNIARGTGETEAEKPAAPTTTQTPTTPSPTPAPDDEDDGKKDEKKDDGVPKVEVGPTNTMQIGPWNATSEISQRFGSVSFNIPDGSNLVLSSDLLSQFPDSCADDRDGWGATKNGNDYEVLKPANRCTEAPELYDEVWGLVDAWVDTIKPM